jgi:hypothetical protein
MTAAETLRTGGCALVLAAPRRPSLGGRIADQDSHATRTPTDLGTLPEAVRDLVAAFCHDMASPADAPHSSSRRSTEPRSGPTTAG